MRPVFHSRLWLLAFCMILFIVTSCGSKEKYVGAYKSENVGSSQQTETSLELKDNGEGIWKVNDEEVSFAWYIKGDELRVNTKGGGVIVGKLENDVIQLTLPGYQTMSFKKVQ